MKQISMNINKNLVLNKTDIIKTKEMTKKKKNLDEQILKVFQEYEKSQQNAKSLIQNETVNETNISLYI